MAGKRRWSGWGMEGVAYAAPKAARAWLAGRLGSGDALQAVAEEAVSLPPARPLPGLPVPTLTDAATRLRHACGQSFPDLLALRTGTVAAFPDGVVAPESKEQVVAVLRAAAAAGIVVVVRGGGTSVVGGVTIPALERPCVVLSLERLTGLVAVDATSRLATFLAGTLGPDVDAALAPHGLRLGHEPQSYELSTVGGWIAARSAGQRSTGIGKIEELLAGVELATVEGLWRLPAQPASAAGPELRHWVLGSEGRLGVITEATVRVRPVPAHEDGLVVLLPSWDEGLAVCRQMLQDGVPVEVLRLSDPGETSLASALVELSPLAARASRLIFATRRFRKGCALLLGWTGSAAEVAQARLAAAEAWRAHRGMAVGRAGWKRWRRDRFRHPYLRDELLTAGWGVDTFETAAPWSALRALYDAVRGGLDEASRALGAKVAVVCHLSHAYRDGASLYFTFFWPLHRGAELAQWTAFKEAATQALLGAGGTLTHHHGVGTMHAPWLEQEIGAQGIALLRGACAALDPRGVLNPGVLLEGARREAKGERQ